MCVGLIDNIQAPELSDEEEKQLKHFLAYLTVAPSEFHALPEEEQEAVAELSASWHLLRLDLTRTAYKK